MYIFQCILTSNLFKINKVILRRIQIWFSINKLHSNISSIFLPLCIALTLVGCFWFSLFYRPIFFVGHFCSCCPPLLLLLPAVVELLSGWSSRLASPRTSLRLLSFICLFAIFIFTHIIAFNACCLGSQCPPSLPSSLGQSGTVHVRLLLCFGLRWRLLVEPRLSLSLGLCACACVWSWCSLGRL